MFDLFEDASPSFWRYGWNSEEAFEVENRLLHIMLTLVKFLHFGRIPRITRTRIWAQDNVLPYIDHIYIYSEVNPNKLAVCETFSFAIVRRVELLVQKHSWDSVSLNKKFLLYFSFLPNQKEQSKMVFVPLENCPCALCSNVSELLWFISMGLPLPITVVQRQCVFTWNECAFKKSSWQIALKLFIFWFSHSEYCNRRPSWKLRCSSGCKSIARGDAWTRLQQWSNQGDYASPDSQSTSGDR